MTISISFCKYKVDTKVTPNYKEPPAEPQSRTYTDIIEYFNKPTNDSIYTNKITNDISLELVEFSLINVEDENANDEDEDDDDDDEDEDEDEDDISVIRKWLTFEIINESTNNITTLFLNIENIENIENIKENVTFEDNNNTPDYIYIISYDINGQNLTTQIYNYENKQKIDLGTSQYQPKNTIYQKYNLSLIANDVNVILENNKFNKHNYEPNDLRDQKKLQNIPKEIYASFIYNLYKTNPRIKLIHAIGLPGKGEIESKIKQILNGEPNNVIKKFNIKKKQKQNIESLLNNMNICVQNINTMNKTLENIPNEEDIYTFNVYKDYFKNLEKKINNAIITYVKINNTTPANFNEERFKLLIHKDRKRMVIKYNEDNESYYKTTNNVIVKEKTWETYKKSTGYLLGNFTNIFLPTETNKQIVDQMDHVIDLTTIENPPPIFIIGYGSSGAGKTSNLIYFKNQIPDGKDEDGILPTLCKKIIEKNKKKTKNGDITITLNTQELYGTKLTSQDEPDIKLFKSPKFNFEYNGKDILLTTNIDLPIQHFYRFNYDPSNVLLQNDIFESNITTTGGNPIKNVKKDTLLGKVIQFLVDTDRIVKATTNNRQSSRSHVLVFVDIKIGTKNINLIVGDFAGIENEFICEEATLDAMDKQVNTNKKNMKTGKYKTFYMHEPILGKEYDNIDSIMGGSESKGSSIMVGAGSKDGSKVSNIAFDEQNETIIDEYIQEIETKKLNNKNLNDDIKQLLPNDSDETITFRYSNDIIKNLIKTTEVNILNNEKTIADKNVLNTQLAKLNVELTKKQDDLKELSKTSRDDQQYEQFKINIFTSLNSGETAERFNIDNYKNLTSKIIEKNVSPVTITNASEINLKFKQAYNSIIAKNANIANHNEYIPYETDINVIRDYTTGIYIMYDGSVEVIQYGQTDTTKVERKKKNIFIKCYTDNYDVRVQRIALSKFEWGIDFYDWVKKCNTIYNDKKAIDKNNSQKSLNKVEKGNEINKSEELIKNQTILINSFDKDTLEKYSKDINTLYGYMKQNQNQNQNQTDNILTQYIYLILLKKHILSKACDNRKKEGYWINSSLKEMRLAIQYIVQSKDFNVFYNYIDTCLKNSNYEPDDIPILDEDEFMEQLTKNAFLSNIFTHLNTQRSDIYPDILTMAKKMVISVYCVFNYTASLNDPPTSPYYNIDILNKIKNSNIDIIQTASGEIIEKLNYLNNIEFLKNVQVYKKEGDELSIKTFLYLDINEDTIQITELMKKLIIKYSGGDTDTLFLCIQLIRNYINNINATSSMGSLEFVDQISKLNTTQYLCTAPNDQDEYSIDVTKKKK